MADEESTAERRAPGGALVRAALDRLGERLRGLLPQAAGPAPSQANETAARAMVALATLVGLGDFARAAEQVPDDERHGFRAAFAFVDAEGVAVGSGDWEGRPVAWLTLTVTCVRVDGAEEVSPAVLRVDMDRDGTLVVRTRQAGGPPLAGLPAPAYERHAFPGVEEAMAALPGLLAGVSIGEAYEHLLRPWRAPLGAVRVGDTAHWVVTRAQGEAERVAGT